VSDVYEILRLKGILITIFAAAFPMNTELVACLSQEGKMTGFLIFGYGNKNSILHFYKR
jgi:hypothetical protein